MNAWKSQNLSPDKSCRWPGWNILVGVLIVGFILIPASAIANAQVLDLHSSLELNNNQTLCPTEDPQTIADSFDSGSWVYCTQAGDTLRSVAARFQVNFADVQHSLPVSPDELLDEGLELIIPRSLNNIFHIQPILPDKEVVYSPSAAGFDTFEFVSRAGGYLSDHQEYLRSTGPTSGPEIVERVALENSVNPRLLLALLEYQCGCVYGSLRDGVDPQFLLGVDDPTRRGLYRQLGWVVNQLSQGYYGWRRGLLTDLSFPDLSSIQLAPDLNSGSAGLAYLFSRLYDRQGWEEAIDPETGFGAMHQRMFGDSWLETDDSEPLFPEGLVQPELILPFVPDREWGYTSGPHQAWETEGALAALDFAPASDEYGCHRSNEWAVAVADGLVARSEHGALVLDLDGDGFEGTGWAILYLHLEERGRVPAGTQVKRGDPLGHPSCEGGPADGTHLHIARKYNGEWIAADGPLPFAMSGWIAYEGYRPFEGTLTRGVQTVVANPLSPAEAFISREVEDNPTLLKISRYLWWEE
jgi:murein DD-endopeptidase MepM/ murein hydrolase activator NlpD